jgi:YVTN family beta-propeller protein
VQRGIAAALTIAMMACRSPSATPVVLLEPPGRDSRARIDGDTAFLVNGRRVTPAGRVLRTQSYAWGLALSPDGSRAAVMNKDAFELVDLREPYAIRRVPPLGTGRSTELGTGSYMGCAFSPDGTRFYYGSANEGRIIVFDVATATIAGVIELNTTEFEDSFPGDLTLSRDGRRLFVVDQFNYRLVTVDVDSRKVLQSVRVGRNPYAVALSPDERFAWVSNVGMFEYPLVPGVTRETRAEKGLPFPAYSSPRTIRRAAGIMSTRTGPFCCLPGRTSAAVMCRRRLPASDRS